MKRDMELIRNILLSIEADPLCDGRPQQGGVSAGKLGIVGHTNEEVLYHTKQLIEAGYLTGNAKFAHMGQITVNKLTWSGHELLDAIRDPDVWERTKVRAKSVTSAGVGFLWEIAKAEVRAKLGLP